MGGVSIRTLAPGFEWAALDLAFERFLRQLPGGSASIARSGRLLSSLRGMGHSRLRLSEWAGCAQLPTLDQWRQDLAASPLVSDGSRPAPLVYDGEDSLSLYRYWLAERRLAECLRRLAESSPEDGLPDSFHRLFPAAGGAEPDWQAIAAASALRHRLCVITGGPGTGKTTVVSKILALLLEREPGVRIRLAAPTGKAAVRLAESLAQTTMKSGAGGGGFKVQTLHALLGGRNGRYRYGADHPLDAQVLIVDETSMADLLLLLAVFDAVAPDCRVILLGDSGQLASVETGCVLADICAAVEAELPEEFCRYLADNKITCPENIALSGRPDASPSTNDGAEAAKAERQQSLFAPATASGTADSGAVSPCADSRRQSGRLAGRIITLRKNWRYAARPGIGAFADALRRGEMPAVDAPDGSVSGANPDEVALRAFLEPQVSALLAAPDPGSALRELMRKRVLCAVRHGEWSVARVNRIGRELCGAGGLARYYPGQPVLIEENDYALGLMNGESGICLPDSAGVLRVWFPGGQCLAPEGLPAHSESWALTIHKSQGAEFDEVLLLLPERDSRALCRELVYTGATRARNKLVILAEEGVLAMAAGRMAERASGLRDFLCQP